MSVKVMGLVWDSELKPSHKLVLLAYADAAEHDGSDIWPGWERMCEMTSYSRSQVARITAELIDVGVLVQVSKGHTGKRASYRIVVDHPALRTVSQDATHQEPDPAPTVSQPRDTVEPESVASDAKECRTYATPPVLSRPIETSLPTVEKSRNHGWDFLTDPNGPFRLPDGTARLRKRVGRLAADINATLDHLDVPDVDRPATLTAAVRAWPLHFETATLTADAFAKHLPALLGTPLRGDRQAVDRYRRDAALAAAVDDAQRRRRRIGTGR